MSTALVLAERHKRLTNELEIARPRIDAILPAGLGMSSGRMIAIVLDASVRQPAILECEPRSIVRATLQSAECGLEIGSPLGEAYLVPFWNGKKGRKEAQFIAGYRGFVKLALAGDRYDSIKSVLVRERDSFTWREGSDAKIIHEPGAGSERERGEVRFAYAIAKIKGGGEVFEVMDREALDRIRVATVSKSRDYKGPWKDHTDEMYRKCPIRRMAKTLELSELLRKAISFDDLNALHRGELGSEGLEGLTGTRVDDLKAAIRARSAPAESLTIDAEFEEVGDGK